MRIELALLKQVLELLQLRILTSLRLVQPLPIRERSPVLALQFDKVAVRIPHAVPWVREV